MTVRRDVEAFGQRAAAFFADRDEPIGNAPDRSRDPLGYAAAARLHQRNLYEAGLAGITWPEDCGGLGLGAEYQQAFATAGRGYETFADIFTIGLGMCGPVLMALGTVDQKRRYLEPMLRGNELWCQLFSEPDAGSDLASLRTTATRDGAGWHVNGQKVWTSFAQHSEFGLLLARTDPDLPKHRGITMFVAELRTPGVSIRPLTQITGDSEFNEVFLDDVCVPDDNVVGAVNAGWRAAMLMLANERVALADSPIRSALTLDAVAELIHRRGQAGDSRVRAKFAEVHLAQQGVDLFAAEMARSITAGQLPGATASIGKLAAGRLAKSLAALAFEVAGEEGTAWEPDDAEGGFWAHAELFAPAQSIAGGTEHIQRTILGEKMLGLPRESL